MRVVIEDIMRPKFGYYSCKGCLSLTITFWVVSFMTEKFFQEAWGPSEGYFFQILHLIPIRIHKQRVIKKRRGER